MGRMVSSIALPTAATSMALIHGFCNRALKKGEVAKNYHHDLPFAKAVRTTRDLGQMKIWLLVAAPVRQYRWRRSNSPFGK